MSDQPPIAPLPGPVGRLVRDAERMTSMADTAELMGDDAGAERFRADAAALREIAMRRLDG